MPTVAVLDYGSGNIRSASRAVKNAGATVVVSSDQKTIIGCDGLLVPGVGAFDACMQGINAINGKEITAHFIAHAKPVLGICVGMQILFSEGIEHGKHSWGLNFLPGKVAKIQADIIPHMGWNTVDKHPQSRLFHHMKDTERYYFVHSYGVREQDRPQYEDEIITYGYHGERFIAAIEKNNLWATQFHPEKSGDAGMQLFNNWLGTF